MKKMFILMCFCLSFSAFADWDPGDSYKMHFPQLPDPTGWDVCLCCQWIADDFKCTETGNITDIHFWISWNQDWIGDLTARNLDVSIWSNAAAANMPGTQLWQLVGGNVVVRPYGQGSQGWVCPSPPPMVAPNNHQQFFQVNITQINEPLRQIAGTTYWLVIKVNLLSPPWPNGPAVGWKTAINTPTTPPFQSPSLWSINKTIWQPVNMVVPQIWDQAFVITNDGQQDALDFGDAPDPSYATLLASNGARHIIRPVGPWLGDGQDNPDPEADGQPTPNADGDDLNGNDDEDGVQIPPLTIGQPSIITFEVNSSDGGGGTVYGWIDFDGDGTWGITEQIVAANYPNGIHSVNVIPPAGSIVGGTYARFRITRDLTGIPSPKGLLSDGEVEDYPVTIQEEILLDFGDAPDRPYPTLLASNGARHIIRPVGPWLGDRQDNPDPEADGQPTPNADGDDLNSNDDEDGVQIPVLTIGQMSTIAFEVNSADGLGGTVYGWIDFDGDGTWGITEQIIAAGYPNGVYNVNVVPPAGSIVGPTFARFRISRDLTASIPVGLARDGEVEDHPVVIKEEIVNEELKFQQLPLNGPMYFGHDELSTVYPVYEPGGTGEPLIVEYKGCYMADDFADLASSPVIRVKWWGSYFGNEIVQPVLSFIVAFESDVPAVGKPGTPDYTPSHPGVILSKEEVQRDMDGILTPGEFREIAVGPGGPPCNEALYRYEALLENPFPQKPNTVYWLKIVAVVELPPTHTLWQDVARWPNGDGDVCNYLVNGYGQLPQFQPVTRWGWHNRDYTVRDPYASTPPAVVPGEHLAGILPGPAAETKVWHFQDDAVAGHVFMPVDPTAQPRKIMDVFQPDWMEQYYKYFLSYCPSPSQQGVDGPEGIGQFSKDLAFELWTSPETVSTPITPIGPVAGITNVTYNYFTGGSISSLGHPIEYQFDWGSGPSGVWVTAMPQGQSWPTPGIYVVKAQARCQLHPAIVSAWSAGLSVVIKKNCRDFFTGAKLTNYDAFVLQGKDPRCWCWKYQCEGDADNATSGAPYYYRIYTGDLNRITTNWKRKIVPGTLPGAEPYADIDHVNSGAPYYYQIYTADLNKVTTNWKRKDTAGTLPAVPVCAEWIP